MKIELLLVIELKGSCAGITATQIDRTETKALYQRSDGYFECFYISETRYNVFKDGNWTRTSDTIERYPRDDKFGISAWCGKEKSIRTIYQAMKENRSAISDSTVEHISLRSIESGVTIPL